MSDNSDSSSYEEDDYSSDDETEETESDKKVKEAPKKEQSKPQQKSSDESDDSDDDDSGDNESDDGYSDDDDSDNDDSDKKEADPPPKEEKKKEPITKPPAKPTKKDSTESDDSYGEGTESEKPTKKPEQKSSETKKEETKKVAQESSSAKQKSETESEDYSENYQTDPGSSEKPKPPPKKSSQPEPKKEDKKASKKSATTENRETDQKPKEKVRQVQQTATSGDLSQPPDFSVPQDVIDEANSHKIDRYGWIEYEEPSTKEKKLLEDELKKEEERSKKWKKMMKGKKWSYYQTRKGYRVVKERTIKGIPNDVRAKAWQLLLDPPESRDPKRGTVQSFFDKGVPTVEHTIRADIPRTMPNVPEFLKTDTRQHLYRILRAYSNASGGGGYYQGMGFYAAIYLLYIKDEEKSFWCFSNLMMNEKHKLKDLFENEFGGLKILNAVWEVLLEKKFKNVYNKLKDLMVDPMIYTPSWFLCAFLDLDFPPPLRLRIIDRIIVFGTRQLLSLALAVIDLNQETILAKSSQMETILPLLQNPTTAETMKDWREVVKKWDRHYLSKKDYAALFKKAGKQEIP